jgi:thymidylate synthase (FAD)
MSKVTLVAITKPCIEGLETAEDLVAYTARVSNPSNQLNQDTAPKLLKYLVANQHWSPFEMAHIVLEIETTRDIARQILRHRSFAFQEFSQRYARADQLGFTRREARMQDAKNRQASIQTDDIELQKLWDLKQGDLLRKVKDTYSWALSNGIAKEQARAVLPEGLTMSRMYMSGSLRSWLHYCAVRCDISTQKEHREVADSVLQILQKEFPSIADIVSK